MPKIKPSIRPTETYTEPNFLRLHTSLESSGSPIRLATIEHLSYRADPQAERKGWRCETIVDGEAMSKEDAMFIASTYARENDIPVIYECHSD
jgi:hypothetical protein